MSVIIEYKFTDGHIPTKGDIAVCDEGRKAFQNLMVVAAKVINPKKVWLSWLITRFFKRTIVGNYIMYEFYLIPEEKKIEHEIYER